MTDRGIGLAAAVDRDTIVGVAELAQTLGFHSFWLNNPPGGTALARLGAVAPGVPKLMLGVGVIPLSHDTPDAIAAGVRDAAIPQTRFYLGIGSGAGPGGVERVRHGVGAVRTRLGCALVVAALGPAMCRLGGEVADGVLLNWLTPEFAERSLAWIREGADRSGRPVPRVMAYVRAAPAGEGEQRLEREAAAYEGYPQYAAHFRRMGAGARETAVHGTPDELRRGLAAWDGVVDEVIVRVIAPTDGAAEIERLVHAVAPASPR